MGLFVITELLTSEKEVGEPVSGSVRWENLIAHCSHVDGGRAMSQETGASVEAGKSKATYSQKPILDFTASRIMDDLCSFEPLPL